MGYLCRTEHPWVSNPKQPSVHPFTLATPTQTYTYLVRGNTTGLSQSATQKATNLAVATGIAKADVPTKQTNDKADVPTKQADDEADVPTKQADEDVGKGYPETLTSGDISGAKQAVGNIKPGMAVHSSSSPTINLGSLPPVAFDIKQAPEVSMPSTETQGQQPEEHISGVGSLPGPSDEQGVAVLPEERVTKTVESICPEHRGGVDSLPGPNDEQDVAVLPEERATKTTTESIHREHHEELADLPEETKSTGARGVGIGGVTGSLKPTQSRVRTDPHLRISQTPVNPERVHSGLVSSTSPLFSSGPVFTLSAVTFLVGTG